MDPGHQPVGRLKSVLFHYTFASFKSLAEKCDERATYNARHASYRSPGKLRLRAVVEWPWVFTKYYFLRRHFTAGFDGLVYAAIIAHYRHARLLRMLAMQANAGAAHGSAAEVLSPSPLRATA